MWRQASLSSVKGGFLSPGENSESKMTVEFFKALPVATILPPGLEARL
jgi:hypothetical protein